MKTCSKCGKTKELSKFSKRSSRPSGVQSKCKDCERESRRRYYKPHEATRRKLNISDAEYHKLLSESNNCCNICNRILDKKCIDHCHTTNKVRGILCNNCNTALGLVGDNIQTLESMIKYLKKNSSI